MARRILGGFWVPSSVTLQPIKVSQTARAGVGRIHRLRNAIRLWRTAVNVRVLDIYQGIMSGREPEGAAAVHALIGL